jgi:hypothetical protein
MLPKLDKDKDKDKDKGKDKSPAKKSKKKEGSRLGKLAGVVADYAVARPAKFAGNMMLSGLMRELPEISMLTNYMADFIGDISDTFKKQKKTSNEDDKKPEEKKADQSISEIKASIDSMREELEKQTFILSSDLSQIKIELGLLENIYGEIRTLSKITAKVWDVQDKTLRDMRYRQKQQAAIERKKMFKDRISQIDNQTLQENQDSINPVEQKEKPKGFLSHMLGMGEGIIDILKQALGIGAGVSIGTRLVKALAKPLVSVMRSIMKPIGVAAGSFMFGKFLGEQLAEMIVTEKFTENWDKAIESIKKSWDDVTVYVSDLIDALPDPVKDAFSSMKKFASEAMGAVVQVMKDGLRNIYNALPQWVRDKLDLNIVDDQTETALTMNRGKVPQQRVIPTSPLISLPSDPVIEMNNGKLEYNGAKTGSELLGYNEKNITKDNFEEKRASSLELQKAKEDIQGMGNNQSPIIIQPQQINAPTTNTNNSRTNINVLGGGSWREKQILNMSNFSA